jgi:hypothetical protein
MSLVRQINEWKEYPNSLGSEARAAVLVADVANSLKEEVPPKVMSALRVLALRGTLRDLAIELRGDRIGRASADIADVEDVAATASGLSWTEAITVIVGYLNRAIEPRRGASKKAPKTRRR